jgi:hypothetical protein
MKKHRSVVWFFLVFGIATASCGSRPKTGDGSGAKEVSRSQLKAELNPHWAWIDAEMRGLSRPLDWASEDTSEGLNYPRVLQLLSREERIAREPGENLFYVLSDGRDRSEIQRVEYEIVRQDINARSAALTGRRDAIYQESDRRFLIPVLSELGSRPLLQELDLYVIRLRIHFSEHVQELRVTFKLSGPLPDLNRKEVGAVNGGEGTFGIRGLAESGLAWAYAETWENPSSRRMRLRFTLKSDLRWRSLLERTDFTVHVWSPPTGRKWIESSEVTVRPGVLRVRSNQFGDYLVPLEGKSEVDLAIAPGEEITIAWGVIPHPHSGRCALPQREVHTVSWSEERFRPGGRGEGPIETSVTRSGSAVRETHLLGWNLERPYHGTYRLRALEAQDPRDEVQIENILPPQPQFYGLHSGSAFSSFPCQGLIE